MKSVAAVALFALAAGVAAEDPDCEASFIVDQCKSSQNDRISDCANQDWDCLCPAYEALRTCYNNCPNDSDIGSVDGQVTIFCQNASLYGSKATATATTAPTGTNTSGVTAPTATDADADEDSNSDSDSDSNGDDDSAAAGLACSVGAALVGVVGVVAAIF